MFSFLKSEKLGTDCAREFSARRFPEEKFAPLTADRDIAEVRGMDEGMLRLGKDFLLCVLLEAPSPEADSPGNVSRPYICSGGEPNSSSSSL